MRPNAEERARAFLRLAALTRRGVPLPGALDALAGEIPRLAGPLLEASARAREGGSLEAVLGETPLADPADRALLRAGGSRPAYALELLGEDYRTRAEIRDALRRVLFRPLWKLCGIVALAVLLLVVFRSVVVDP